MRPLIVQLQDFVKQWQEPVFTDTKTYWLDCQS